MVRPAQFLGPLQGYQPTLPAPASRTLRVPAQPRAPALASGLRSSLAVYLLDHGRLFTADGPSTSPDAANALLPMSVEECLAITEQLEVGRFTPKIDGDSAVFTGLASSVAHGPPSGIRSRKLSRHDGGNALQSQDHRERLRGLPLKAMECGFI